MSVSAADAPHDLPVRGLPTGKKHVRRTARTAEDSEAAGERQVQSQRALTGQLLADWTLHRKDMNNPG